MIQVLCPTEADTTAFVSKLAADLRPGDVVSLIGELGAGKTRFVSGLAAGLGVDETVASPSFVLVREYRSGFLPLYHADAYRLSSLAEFDDLDIFNRAADGILAIEWGNAVEPMLGESYLELVIERLPDEARVLKMTGHGSWRGRDLESVR